MPSLLKLSRDLLMIDPNIFLVKLADEGFEMVLEVRIGTLN